MSGFLSEMCARRREELAVRAGRVDRGALAARVEALSARDFAGALRLTRAARGVAVIAEFKRRSPSVAGFPNAVDPAASARLYAAHGSAAMSVVIDAEHFGTTLEDLSAARVAGGMPMLAKDFVVDPLQALEARAAGADALLLIVRALSRGELETLLGTVAELGMTALAECHDEADVEAALAAGAPMIGINGRDLETLEVDGSAHARLLPLVKGRVPGVAESGLGSRADVEKVVACGADAVLVGGALLTTNDPAALLRDMGGA